MATFKQYSQTLNDASEAFSIESFTSDEIKVRVDGVLKSAGTHYNITSYTTNGGTVTWTSGNIPAENAVVRIYRITTLSSAQATYAAGSSIKAGDLNNNQTQILRALQESGHQTDILVQNWDYEPNSVTTTEILDDTIVNANVASNAAIAQSKLNIANATTSAAGYASAADKTKLDGIETAATADQTAAEIRTLVGSATDSQVFTDADHTKLDGIEASATADQTNTEIRTAVEAASDSNVFTDADHSKLDGIAASANNYSHPNHSGEVTSTGDGATVITDNVVDEANLKVSNSPTNNYILTADATVTGGLKWAAAGAGGDANQNAFSNVAVSGQTTVAADTATDTLTIVGGTNVTVTTDASADSVTIAASGGEVTVQDEGSALSTAATTLNFVGSGVVASGTGATKTITISGGGGAVTTDFQYLELKAHNNASGAFSAGAADYELVTKGTTTAVDPGQAAALMISIGGVLQEPNTGTSISSNDGFCVDGSSIHFGANLTAHPEYILWLKGSGSHTIDANSITNAKMADDAIGIAELSATGTAGNTTFLRGDNSWQVVDTTIADDSIVEAKLDIHAAPAGTNKFLGYTANGMEWAVPPDTDNNTQLTEEQVEDFVGGMVTGNTETGITVTYEDSDGTLDFVVADQTPEGTAILSTGEGGGTKFLREDGDGTSSWQAVPAGTPTTTRGDIIYRAASADARLAKGTSGQYLKIGANDPEWADVVGAVADGCIFENDQTISNNYTIASGKGAHSVGPITVNATVTVNGNWVVS